MSVGPSMRCLAALAFGIAFQVPASSQDAGAESEILILGEKLLGQAKAQYEGKEWLETIDLAERARTAFLALSELSASQKRAADLRKLNDAVAQCNQLIRLARDARKAEAEKPAPANPPPPNPPPPAKNPDPAPVARPEPPPQDAQERAEKAIREVFQAEYAKAASAAEKQAFARKLLKEAIETPSDRAAQYVLFREASDLAVQASDIGTAFSAVAEMAKVFAVDSLAMRVAAISKLPTGNSHDTSKAMVEGTFGVVDEAVRADHYDIASIVLRKAESHAKSPLNVTLVAQVQARAKEILEIQKERQAIRGAEKALLDKPDHPISSLLVGRFLCFQKGDWEKGLPLLRKGADPDLRKLAEAETANAGAEEQMTLADGWWAVAEKEVSPIAKDSIHAHARGWYERALPGLAGFPRTKVQTRLQQMEEEESSRWAVNLMKLIDLKKDALSGTWTVDGNSLVSPAGDNRRLQIPYDPPEEYDLKIVAARRGGPNAALIMGLVGGNRQFCMDLDGWDGSTGGLALMDGKGGNANETTFRTKVFSDDGAKTLVWQVRKDKVVFSADGRKLLEWKADYRRLSNPAVYVFPSKRALYLVTWYAGVHFRQILLFPVSGQGQKLR